ncbi:MAG TPA: ABC transporter permease [Chthoniobacteraceae bacterium]|jgi:NitT/TauT family transport system permease protein
MNTLAPDSISLGDRETIDLAGAPRRGPAGRWRGVVRSGVVRLLSIAACLGLWQLASTKQLEIGFLRFANVPPPTEVASAGVRLAQSPKLISHVRSSVLRIFAGFAIAAALAVPLGMIIGRSRVAGNLLLAPLEVLRPIPAVAWIPLAILMFATAEQSMIYITFIGAFFPILLSTVHGVESLDRKLVFASMTLGAGRLAVFREVILPGALPSIVTGLSIGMGTSWFSLVTAEMISGQFGIGYYTWEAYTLQNYPDIVLGMITIGLLGMLSSAIIKQLGSRLMPWFQIGGEVT